ncbi:MAG: type III pantothenate kinase [Candidatus Cloacimonas sp.]|jgi:type III pantothenate kinase|nr:type III pantothenate kinase [Candidatus Cloacimonas sp.]
MRTFPIKEPILVVDIGNTNIVCALYQNGESLWSVRLQSDSKRTADEYYGALSCLIRDIAFESIRYVAMGSVVPELGRVWKHLFTRYSTAIVIEINALSPLGLQFKVPNPAFIGADLIANAYAAWKIYRQNAIIIDLGTATTIQVVSSTGLFDGCIIAPGMKTGALNLFEKATKISEIELVSPTCLLGTNTQDAVLSGIIYGHAYMLEAFVTQLKQQYFERSPMVTILCGGLANLIKPILPNADLIDKSLTLDGLHLALISLLQA